MYRKNIYIRDEYNIYTENIFVMKNKFRRQLRMLMKVRVSD